MARLRIPVLFLLIVASIGILITSCGSGEKDGEASVSLDLNGGASTPAAEDSTPAAGNGPSSGAQPGGEQEAQPAEAAAPREPEPRPAPATTGSSDALLQLDRWHRASEDQRARTLAGDGPAMEALRAFAQIWGGGAAAYRSRLQVAPVTVFGDEFEGYARAWSEGGVEALQAALSRGPGSGPAWLAWTDALVGVGLQEQKLAEAGTALGGLLPGMLAAGYERERVLEFRDAVATLASQVDRYLPSEPYEVPSGSSYVAIWKRFRGDGIDAYPGWVADFNGERKDDGSFDYLGLRAGQDLRIPQVKLHLMGWRQARIAALYAGGVPVRLYSISVGKQETPTPLGEFTVGEELMQPMWYPPGGGALPFGHPDNPLGERWIGFKEDTSYAFHGTNSEETIGGFESRGCIRMHNADVIELFELIGPGAKVTLLP